MLWRFSESLTRSIFISKMVILSMSSPRLIGASIFMHCPFQIVLILNHAGTCPVPTLQN